LDDDPDVVGTPSWIERDQFVYFLTMARELGDPHDWPVFRGELVAALRAAWGFDALWLHLDRDGQHARRDARIARAYDILDQTRQRHDPAVNWEEFAASLWASRGPLTGAA
jgi:hypothetical protein